jgi:dipeptidyl-peptidase-4
MALTRFFLPFFFLTLQLNLSAQEQKKLTLNDFITNHTFESESVRDVNSMNDGIHFSSLRDGTSIVKYSYSTGKEADTIFSLKNLKDSPINEISTYTFSTDEKRILIESKKKPIYRRSYTAEYYIWDEYTETLYELSEYGPQQAATFSPDGERVAFVRDNNIFIKTIRFGTEQQVTSDGKFNEIINGIPDWVYEEEFGYSRAFEWSPNSDKLAYVKFDESLVKEFPMQIYKGLSPEKSENELYPGYYKFKYPKAGEENSRVSVHVFDIKTRTNIKTDTGEETDIYIPRLKWSLDGENLAVFSLNRRQNELTVLYSNPYTGDSRTLFTEKNKRYIESDFLDYFSFLDDNSHFVVMSERDGWSHLYLYKNNGFLIKQITDGEFDVTDFYGYDSSRKLFFYQAAKESPLQREVYSISLDGKKQEKISLHAGTNSAIFSANYKYYLNYYSNINTPEMVSVYNQKGNEVRIIEDNRNLKEKLQEYVLPTHEFFSFETSEGTELNGYMLKPSYFDPTSEYPVVMYQYSGPNSQQVADKWKIDWHYFLAEQGYIIVCVDPRGTAARGEDFRKGIYMQLGRQESDDQIETARYISTLPYIDAENICIWGWSYGGFISSLALGKGGDVFKAAVSVAPVTNWRYYDTVYTERYMRTPQQNPDGYDDNSPINNISGITGNLLIIHGTADDNVHAQNTYEYAEALVQEGIPFDMHLYTNRNHSIFGGNTRLHLYTKIFKYFETHLK